MLCGSVTIEPSSAHPSESTLILTNFCQCSQRTSMDQPPKAPDLQAFSVLSIPDGISAYTSDLGSVLVASDCNLAWLGEKEPSSATDSNQ